MLYRTSGPVGLERMLPLDAYLAYLEDCAKRWQNLGHADMAELVRARMQRIQREAKDEI